MCISVHSCAYMEDLYFMTAEEFAEKMNIQRRLVYSWLKRGKIKGIRVSDAEMSRWRIPCTELKRLHAQAYEENDDRIYMLFYNLDVYIMVY